MIVSRPTKPSPLLDPTPKKKGGLSWPTVYVGQCASKSLHRGHALADRGVPAEKTQASVKGSHWLAPNLREEADVLWLDKSGI